MNNNQDLKSTLWCTAQVNCSVYPHLHVTGHNFRTGWNVLIWKINFSHIPIKNYIGLFSRCQYYHTLGMNSLLNHRLKKTKINLFATDLLIKSSNFLKCLADGIAKYFRNILLLPFSQVHKLKDNHNFIIIVCFDPGIYMVYLPFSWHNTNKHCTFHRNIWILYLST